MNCVKCGKNVGENDRFCPNCGELLQKVNQNIDEVKSEENSFTYEKAVNQQESYNQPNYSQLNYNQQQQNQSNYGQPNQKSKNSEDIVKIVVGTVIGLAILIAIAFIIYSLISSKDKNSDNNSQVSFGNQSSGIGAGSLTDYTDPMTTVSNTQSTSYKVSYSGFKLYIPDNLVYEMDYANDAINVGDGMQTWVVQLSIQQAPFQKLKQNKSQLTAFFNEYLSEYNPKVSTATIENVNGVEIIVVEVTAAGENMLMGIAGLNSMYSMCFTLVNEDNNFDRDYLKNVATIIKTAEYTGDSSYMKANENIKMKDIKSALQKVAEAQPNQ